MAKKAASPVPGAIIGTMLSKVYCYDPNLFMREAKIESIPDSLPVLEMDGVYLAFIPERNYHGKIMGWTISLYHPLANALEAADSALSETIKEYGTLDYWEELAPTLRRGGEVYLQEKCDMEEIRTFIQHAKAHGFKNSKLTGGEE